MTGSSDGFILRSVLETGNPIGSFIGHTDSINDMVISSNSTYLYTASNDRLIKLWNCLNFKCLNTFIGHESDIDCLKLSECDSILFSGSKDSFVIQLNA